MQIVSTTALISINGTLIAQLVSFLIFLYVLNRVMIRPLQDAMAARSSHIDKIKQDIGDAEEDVKRFVAQLEKGRISVLSEAHEIAKKLEESGSSEADAVFASTRKEIGVLRERAEKDVDAQLAEARKHIKTESEAIAVRAMEKILDRRPAP
ncbi:MAG: ATP synthase F0 subunit B [Pseudomonadota bacterium]